MTRAFLAATGLAVVLGGLLVASPASAKDGTVIINAPGIDDRSVTIRLNSLGSPDINNQDYVLSSGRKTISGYSISKVLRAAAEEAGEWLDLETRPSIKVDRPKGGPVSLTASQALEQRDTPPVFYENSGNTVFVMPGSPGQEYVFRLSPIGIELDSQGQIEIALSAKPKRPRKGQVVRISARVTGAPAGARLSFRWSFSDGTIRTTSVPSVTHRFNRQGRRSVVVTVEGGEAQGQAVLAIDVAKERGESDNGPSPSAGTETSVPAGSDVDGSGYGGSGVGYGPGSGGFPEIGSPAMPGSAPTPPEDEDRPVEKSPDDLEEVSGVVIDPAASASAAAPESGSPEGSGGFGGDGLGFSGEAATLLGVGLLIALGGLIETRILFRRF